MRCPREISVAIPRLLPGAQALSELVEACPDDVVAEVGAKGGDRRLPLLQMEASEIEIADLPVDLTEVQVQGGVEGGHRAGDASGLRPVVSDEFRGLEGAQVPDQFVVRIVLDVSK